MRRVTPLLAALLAPALLAACGGSGSNPEIAAAVEAAATSTDPADCTRLVTQSFVEQTEFQSGPAALRACRADAPDGSTDPRSVDVSGIVVHGDTATARATFHGGSFDSQILEIELADDRGHWKLDRIGGIPGFDAAAYARAFEQTATRGASPLRAGQAACVSQRIRAARPAQLRTALLSGDAAQVATLILRGCAR